MEYIPRVLAIPEPIEGYSAPRRMNPTEIEFALRDLVSKPYDAGSFAYDLIAVFNASKMTVSRLKGGTTNKATRLGDVLWQKNLFFRSAQQGEDVGAVGDSLLADPLTTKHKPRFILVTNGQQVHIRDLKFDETSNVEFERLDEQSYFLLPLAGYERRAIVEEHPADIKAAKKLKKLYDAMLAANPTWNTGHHSHELNLLMTRLLFCFYAEKTGIFDIPRVFTSTVTDFTGEDGKEVAPLLDRLFRVMNVEESSRSTSIPASEARVPYVNGSLFEDTVPIPQFSRTARRQLLECGDLDWTTINPDIFGSMIQTVAQDGTRSDLGMHYTSVPNIMKVLQPLFLDDLESAYEKAKDSVPKLESLLGRLSKIRVFDPACGSGNFLVIAYKKMRKLEIQILKRVGDISKNAPLRLSGISLNHFYGIDVVDFACETAKLSLWIAEHQMNTIFKDEFGSARPTLPLAKITTIHCANATRVNWSTICVPDSNRETFLCGNPPYQGGKQQTALQKADMAFVFQAVTNTFSEFDYVSAWFIKTADYIASSPNTSAALVATNSICQGWHVPRLWPLLLKHSVSIEFAHTSFKWDNSAAHNAGVSCVIIGLSTNEKRQRKLFTSDHQVIAKTISPYLVPTLSQVIVEPRSQPISDVPPMFFGNMTYDAGNLILSVAEKHQLLAHFPQASVLIRRLWGSKEFLHSLERYCIWIDDSRLELAMSIPPIAKRIKAVKKMREASTDPYAASVLSLRPHQFKTMHYGDALIIPTVTSERRQFLQVGLMSDGDVVNNLAFVVYHAGPELFAILSSKLHYVWANTVGGKLESRLRYSNTLVYNTFPIPTLSESQKRALRERARTILRARATHPGKPIAWLYNPESMPASLLNAHCENDVYIEEHVYGRTFRDDAHRLEHLFEAYATMNAGQAPLLSTAISGKVSQGNA